MTLSQFLLLCINVSNPPACLVRRELSSLPELEGKKEEKKGKRIKGKGLILYKARYFPKTLAT